MLPGGITLVRSRVPRAKPDTIAIATKGKVTSQIEAQKSDDKPVIISTLDEN